MRPFWLVVLVALPITLHAQMGSGSACCATLTPHVQAGQLTVHDDGGGQRRDWLQAIVLWRANGDINGGYSSAGAPDVESQMDAGRAASRKLGRSNLGVVTGGRYYHIEYDQEHMWVLSHEFVLPRRDSALVVMIDGVDEPGGPRIAGHAYISSAMPEKFWPKAWTSGDTTFTIHAKNADSLLLEALRASPEVRAFVDGTGSR